MARRRSFWQQMRPDRVLMRLLFGHPRNHPSLHALRKPRRVARIRRDPVTGDVRASGVRRGPDGWTAARRRRARKS